jgi:alpha-beta hydrolase superfamily lysophospholipase
MMEHREGRFMGWQNLPLYYQCWMPTLQPDQILVMVHGLGSHSGLWRNAVRCLVPQGYGVYAMDMRGHGRSPGLRGHIQHWQDFREDLAAFLQHIQTIEHAKQYYLWGHSLGATVCLDYVLHQPAHPSTPLQGLILSAPALGKVGVGQWKLMLGQLLSVIWPSFRLKLGIDHYASSRIPAVVKAHMSDPLRHEYGSARLATEFAQAVHWTQAHLHELNVPLLLLHGGADLITNPETSRNLFNKIQVTDKTYREYPHSYHDLYEDLNDMEVIGDISDWLSQRSLHQKSNFSPQNCLLSV